MTIADRIKEYRERMDITQDELSKKMGYKDRSNISKIEASGNNISLKKITKVAEALGVTESYLMGWEDESGTDLIADMIMGKDNGCTEFVQKFNLLSDSNKNIVLTLMDSMIAQQSSS